MRSLITSQGSVSLLGATEGFSQLKGERWAAIWPAEQYREAPFSPALAEEPIGLIAKLEASSLAPTPGDLERRGMAIARQFGKGALGLVQSPLPCAHFHPWPVQNAFCCKKRGVSY